jgi:hypothetical protein
MSNGLGMVDHTHGHIGHLPIDFSVWGHVKIQFTKAKICRPRNSFGRGFKTVMQLFKKYLQYWKEFPTNVFTVSTP